MYERGRAGLSRYYTHVDVAPVVVVQASSPDSLAKVHANAYADAVNVSSSPFGVLFTSTLSIFTELLQSLWRFCSALSLSPCSPPLGSRQKPLRAQVVIFC